VRSRRKAREEARRLYLAGEMSTNAEIAARLKVKPHTVARWRKDEAWDDLRLKIDRRAAEMFVEKIATDRVTLNVRHYRLWELLLAQLMEDLKVRKNLDGREMERIAGILERAQKGQRLAKGLSTTGETEESIRAQSQAEIQRIIDTVIDAIKENVPDETVRDRIRKALLDSLPESPDLEEGAA
jgi:putative ATPase subunit gpP of terminase